MTYSGTTQTTRTYIHTRRLGPGSVHGVVTPDGMGDAGVWVQCLRLIKYLKNSTSYLRKKKNKEKKHTYTQLAQETYMSLFFAMWQPSWLPYVVFARERWVALQRLGLETRCVSSPRLLVLVTKMVRGGRHSRSLHDVQMTANRRLSPFVCVAARGICWLAGRTKEWVRRWWKRNERGGRKE